MGDSEGQGSLVYCSSWGHKDSETAERLNNNNNLLEDGVFGRCLDHEGGALTVELVLFFTFKLH